MKKYLLIFLLLLTSSVAIAQVQTYQSTQFAYKTQNYGVWSGWSNWESSNLKITIDLGNDVVRIYSRATQIYRITEHLENFKDNQGGIQAKFAFVDQDGDRGHIRLRVESNGNSQIYIDYANLIFVYNVKRIY